LVSKPSGVHAQDPRSGVLASLPAVEAALGALRGSLRPVHRLDTPVSGLMCVARTLEAARLLSAALSEGAALAAGGGGGGGGGDVFLRGYIGLTGETLRGSAREGVLRAPLRGVPAATRFRVAAEGRSADGARITALLLSPLTGRKHQLRQHVAQGLCGGAGGLVNDVLYGAPRAAAGWARGAIGLHAGALIVDGGVGAVEAEDPLPPEWTPLLARHGIDAPALSRQLLPFLRASAPV
jgi:23S rRNA-/tRNA-specific pseudouridylate synthase